MEYTESVNQYLDLSIETLKKIKFDFDLNRLILESWKFKREPQTKKRRREEEYFSSNRTLPDTYNLEMIDKMDYSHVSGIILYIVDSTEIQFSINIHTEATAYNLIFSQLEIFEIGMIEKMIKKYGAFISKIGFNFPNKQLELKIRRNDSQLDQITSVRVRKKVKLTH